MLDYLSTLYHNKAEWEARRDSLRREVRQRLELDAFLDSCVLTKDKKGNSQRPVVLSKLRKHDGYTTQNICIELTPGQHLFGTIYASTKKGKHALIVCPDGHWPLRYRKDEQQRMGTLARMGAVCVDFDLYGWGESEKEVGAEAHHSSRAHVYQAACGYILLDYMLKNRKDIDTTRVGVMGGSGGGTHTVLLSLLDERVTASAPPHNTHAVHHPSPTSTLPFPCGCCSSFSCRGNSTKELLHHLPQRNNPRNLEPPSS